MASSTSRASASSPQLRSTVARRSYGSGTYSGVAAATHSRRRESGKCPYGTRFSYTKPPIARPPGPGQLDDTSISVTTFAPFSTTRPSSGRSALNRSSGVTIRRSESSSCRAITNLALCRSTASPNRPSSSRTPPRQSRNCERVPLAGVDAMTMPYGGVVPWIPVSTLTHASLMYSVRSTLS